MRLLLQSHFYLLASAALHTAIFLILVFSSIKFSSRSDTFEAVVHFETPAPQKQITSVQTAKKSDAKAAKDDSQITSSKSLSSRRLDDILKNKGIKVSADDDLDDTVEQKKSDLLGYLRANKQTQKATPKTSPKPAAPTGIDNKTDTSQKAGTSDSEETDSTAGKQQPSDTEVSTPSTLTANTPSQIATARRIWQKKNDIQTYRNILNKYVTANWTLPPGKIKEFQIIIEATIDKNGNLVKIEHLESSGLAILDAAAERAIRVSTPFPELPSSLGPEETFFKATFRFTPGQVLN